MLELRNIFKTYVTGDTKQDALQDVSVTFRDNEFVSILGQSGSGKTTLLNIVGGLDRYTKGDLLINGVSTKKYRDADWDAYRNHSVGFVFQSYNLIPHQSVLANVELALTLAGVSKKERRERALKVLDRVGLSEHVHKKPNQMSGGQMQRVAIARALINDPDILLADEPTGALDSATSTQVMELLKEIAKDKLVIMVTHNPELAQQYSTRIVQLLDGRIVSDSDPCTEKDAPVETPPKRRRVSMSFFTALSLSFNNLRTKKGRTLLTSFAGSIGIIGIALILSLSTGIKAYVDGIQRDTLSSYPITIQQQESPIMAILAPSDELRDQLKGEEHGMDAVYSNDRLYALFNAMFSQEETNDLTGLKAFLDKQLADPDSALNKHASIVMYQYNINMNTFVTDPQGKWRDTDLMKNFSAGFGGEETSGMSGLADMMGGGNNKMNLWNEMLPGNNGELISPMIKEQYDLVAGNWPQAANEVLLVLDKNNEVTDVAFYALGLSEEKAVMDIFKAVMAGKEIETQSQTVSYEQVLGITFKLVTDPEFYQKTQQGRWESIKEDQAAMDVVIGGGYDLKISGIIRPDPEASATLLSGSFAYTTALTDYVLQKTNASEIVKQQREHPDVDVFSGLPFVLPETAEPLDAEKAAQFMAYVATLTDVQKVELYTAILATPPAEQLKAMLDGMMQQLTNREAIVQAIASAAKMDIAAAQEYLADYTDEQLQQLVREQMEKLILTRYEEMATAQVLQIKASAGAADIFGVAGNAAVAQVLQATLATADEQTLAWYYDEHMPPAVSDSTLKENLTALSAVKPETPSAIHLYAKSFDDKAALDGIISDYNRTAPEDQQVTYTDYVALLMSGVTTMIDAVTYGLIAFVSISLVVSSIMIGIITYISVLERTKEIGILRSVGASKRDVSRVFNAETLIIGFAAGLMGILVTVLLNIPISIIIGNLTGIDNIATLPPLAGLILVCVSMALTLIAGTAPARMAAKKDPVVALRSE